MPTIIIGCCMSLVIIAVIIYMFIYFCHPNDKSYGNKWFPKLLVVKSVSYFRCQDYFWQCSSLS